MQSAQSAWGRFREFGGVVSGCSTSTRSAPRASLRCRHSVCFCSKHRYAGATRTLRPKGAPRNGTVTDRARVGRMLGAPRSRSARALRGVRDAGPLQAPAPAGLAAPSVGVGPSASPADGLRRALRARVWPVASSGRRRGRQVPRLRRARPRVHADPLRRPCTRVLARVLLQVPVLVPRLPRQAVGDLDPVALHRAACAGAAPPGGAHPPRASRAGARSPPSTRGPTRRYRRAPASRSSSSRCTCWMITMRVEGFACTMANVRPSGDTS